MPVKQLSLAAVFFVLFINFANIKAEQVYFDIVFDRSSNIDVVNNKSKLNVIGDEISINNQGRVWLSGNEDDNGYVDILCQSQSNEPIILKLDSDAKPWIAIDEKLNCSEWKNDLLVCKVGDAKKGIYCKISDKTKTVLPTSKVLQMAAVTIRSVSQPQQTNESGSLDYTGYLKQSIANYSTGIELCGIMHDKKGPVEISWIIYDGGNTGKIKINIESTDNSDIATAHCIAEQINFWRFPEWKKNYRVNYRF